MTFQFNVTAIGLAKCIFLARAEAFQLEPCVWEALTPHVKAIFVDQAQQVLLANRPVSTSLFDAFVATTRAHAARVVGRIEPDETPWGV